VVVLDVDPGGHQAQTNYRAPNPDKLTTLGGS